ncbi:MAG: hypothetical protein NC489_44735 [Ruminococcus flavefaciens]|nr:hypothetical protein [Ruminococcus flavefaciens]
MYFRKYFAGNTIGTLDEKQAGVKFGAASTTYTIFVNQSRILGNAIAETLRMAGMNAVYDEENFVLYPEKNEEFGIGIIKQALAAHTFVVYGSDATSNFTAATNSGTSYQPFDTNGDAYKFYVTVIGDPKSLLRVHIGAYSATASTSYGFAIGVGKDIRNARKVRFVVTNPSVSTVSFLARYADDCSLIDGMGYSTYIPFTVAAVTGTTEYLILIPAYATNGFISMDNAYLGCSTLSAGNTAFYSINGEEYYYPTTTLLLKCPTTPVL